MATSKASRDYGSTDKDPVANLFRHHPAQFVGPDVVVSDWTDEYMKSNFYVPAFGPVGLSIDDDIVPFSKWSLFFLGYLVKVLSCRWGGVETCFWAALLAGGYLKVW